MADAQIGRFTAIANHVRLGAPNHPMDRASQHRFTYCPEYYDASAARDSGFFADRRAARVIIGHDVWIGSEAVIMPGIRVGHGAVIGTRALVTRNVEPYAVVGGNPAKPIRRRFDDTTIALLLEMAWWDWTEEQLQGAMPLLTSGNVGALHRHWQQQIRGQP